MATRATSRAVGCQPDRSTEESMPRLNLRGFSRVPWTVPLAGIAPLEVRFSARAVSGDAPLTYSWSFGDGGEAEGQETSHVYRSGGTYRALVLVRDADGDEASATIEIRVADNDRPVVEILAAPQRGVAPLEVAFTALVVGGNEPLQHAWDFDEDGVADSVLPDPLRIFAAGSHLVTVTVTDANRDTDSASVLIEVELDTTPRPAASAIPPAGQAPLGVQLGGAVEGGNQPLSFHWGFGNGQSSELQAPFYTYTWPSTYLAICTVTDADGDQASASVSVAVAQDLLPTVQIQADTVVGIAPLQVSFRAVAAGGDAPLTYSWNFYRWDFGDGQGSNLPNPSYTYASAGSYTATCTVIDADGDRATGSTPVQVIADLQPTVTVAAQPSAGLAPPPSSSPPRSAWATPPTATPGISATTPPPARPARATSTRRWARGTTGAGALPPAARTRARTPGPPCSRATTTLSRGRTSATSSARSACPASPRWPFPRCCASGSGTTSPHAPSATSMRSPRRWTWSTPRRPTRLRPTTACSGEWPATLAAPAAGAGSASISAPGAVRAGSSCAGTSACATRRRPRTAGPSTTCSSSPSSTAGATPASWPDRWPTASSGPNTTASAVAPAPRAA
ncbi:MAG: PKD domain-containing protein [Deltaproteobacteria bacterium]|nr:PKD domain-containing protein [Deltaproteobacteria bacterium]